MMDRIWVIPLLAIVMANVGLVAFDSILPTTHKIMGSDYQIIYQPDGYDLKNGTYNVDEVTPNLNDVGDSKISQKDLDSQNTGISISALINSVSDMFGIFGKLTYGVLYPLGRMGIHAVAILIISIPITLLYILMILDLGSLVISAIAGVLK